MRKLLALFAALLLVSQASSFTATLTPEDRTATPDKPAKFQLQVQNSEAEEQSFRISSVTSTPSYWLSYDNLKTVEAGGNTSFNIEINPPNNTIQQNYLFQITLRGETGMEKLEDYFSFSRKNDLLFRAVEFSGKSFKPGETLRAELELLNTASKTVDDHRIALESDLASNTNTGTSIESRQVLSTSISVKIPENARPGENRFRLSIKRENSTRASTTKIISVEKVRKITRNSKTVNRLLYSQEKMEATNRGNFETSIEFNRTIPDYLLPITRFNPEPDHRETFNGSTLYIWNRTAAPGETVSVSYRTDYWMPLAALAVLLTLLLVWKNLRTPLKFEKTASVTEDGVKVRLELENRSDRSLFNVKIEDFVPDIAEVGKEFPMAKPVIRKTNDGTRLQWEVEELEPGDQRVYEYLIHPVVEVEGGVTLPAAEIESEERRISETGKPETGFNPRDT